MGSPFFTPAKLGKIAAESSNPKIRLRAVSHLKDRLDVLHLIHRYRYEKEELYRLPLFEAFDIISIDMPRGCSWLRPVLNPIKSIKLKKLKDKLDSFIESYKLASFKQLLDRCSDNYYFSFDLDYSTISSDYIVALKNIIYEGKHLDSKKEALDDNYLSRESLFKIATEHKDIDVRTFAIDRLANCYHPENLFNVIKGKTLINEDSREYAVNTIIKTINLESEKAKEFFRELCVDAKNPRIRRAAISALFRMYEDALKDEDTFLKDFVYQARSNLKLEYKLRNKYKMEQRPYPVPSPSLSSLTNWGKIEENLLHQFAKICRHSKDKEITEEITKFIMDNCPYAILQVEIYCVIYRSSKENSKAFLSVISERLARYLTEENNLFYTRFKEAVHTSIPKEIKREMSEEDLSKYINSSCAKLRKDIIREFSKILDEVGNLSEYSEIREQCNATIILLRDLLQDSQT